MNETLTKDQRFCAERLAIIKQIPRQADVTDVEDMADEIERQAQRIADLEREHAIWKQCHSAPKVASPPSESRDGVRTHSFWSPDRRLLMTVYVTDDSISVADDNGDIYDEAGKEVVFSNNAAAEPAPPKLERVRSHLHTCANVQPGSTYADECDCGAVVNGEPVRIPDETPVPRAPRVPMCEHRVPLTAHCTGCVDWPRVAVSEGQSR